VKYVSVVPHAKANNVLRITVILLIVDCYQYSNASNVILAWTRMNESLKAMPSPQIMITEIVVMLKITVFWYVLHCSLVNVCRRTGGTCCPIIRAEETGNEGIGFPRNVGKHLTNYTAVYTKR
jgi:hypothetical protein